MSDFKAKMHQIRLRLGLCTRPRWGSSQRSPRPTSWIKGGLLLREEREREREGKEWEGRGGEGEGERKGREGKGKGREGKEMEMEREFGIHNFFYLVIYLVGHQLIRQCMMITGGLSARQMLTHPRKSRSE